MKERRITDAQVREVRRLMEAGALVVNAARTVGMSRTTFYQRENELREFGPRCPATQPGTLGYQRCTRPVEHRRNRHRSQDGKSWGPAPELPGCIECGYADVEDAAEHEAQAGHRFVAGWP